MGGTGQDATRAIGDVMAVVQDGTAAHLRTEFGLDARAGGAGVIDVHRLPLRDVTAMVGIGGVLNAFVAMTFDRRLIDRIAALLTADLDVSEMDPQELREDAAGEVVNTIAGNATAHLDGGGQPLTLTPPVAFADSKAVCRDRDAICWTAAVATDSGELDLTVLGADPANGGPARQTGDAG